MIVLRAVTEIAASPEQIDDWAARFQENYPSWHPDHVACRYVRGNTVRVGSVIAVQEYLDGELFEFDCRITKIVPQSRVDYRASVHKIPFVAGGAYIFEPNGKNGSFIAEIHIGWNIPLLGRVLDKVIQKGFSSQLRALQQHMIEEGQNLKKWFERRHQSGIVPAANLRAT